jgi:hypothetical protein
LDKGQADSVNFINYEGPYARIETRNQIRSIGYGPGQVIQGGAGRAGGLARYFVIHSITPPEGGRLDADIFGLGIDVGVDHIRNLRLIIQGYLEGAYNYSARDAALLAEYITIYNAVFRGNWNYFTTRYKTPVVGNLAPERAGLSIRFDEWPGRTLMLIPLAIGQAGLLSAIDTSSLTSPEVIDEMRKDEDKGIEQRKEMVDLKEREAEEAEQRAALQREAIAKEEARIAQERAAAEAERAQAARERERIAREREEAREAAEAGRSTADEARQTEAELAAREAEAARREAAADETERNLEQREEALAEQREEAKEDEELAERKAAEAREERQDIARDQQAMITREDPQRPEGEGLLGVRLGGADSPLGRFVRVNAANGRELKSSGLDTVNARSVISIGSRIFAVAGENRGGGAIRIVEIDQESLEIARQGEDDIHPQTLLWMSKNKLYAITSQAGNLRFARFSTDLTREAQSAVTVSPYAAPVFLGDAVMIQRTDGSLAVLNEADLSERR